MTTIDEKIKKTIDLCQNFTKNESFEKLEKANNLYKDLVKQGLLKPRGNTLMTMEDASRQNSIEYNHV